MINRSMGNSNFQNIYPRMLNYDIQCVIDNNFASNLVYNICYLMIHIVSENKK